MSDREREDKIELELLAMLDGELDSARAAALLKVLAARPELLRWLEEQQQLKLAANRVAKAVGPAPDELRNRITALANSASAAATVPALTASPSGGSIARQRRWPLIFGCASSLAAGLLIGLFVARSTWKKPAENPLPDRNVIVATDGGGELPIAPTLVINAGRIHADCSRLAAGLHSASFEKVDADLAASVRADLAGQHPYPDLTSIGFRLDGAGPCSPLMPGTIHLLYRSTRPHSVAAISLFVQPNRGQFPRMKTTNLYAVSSARSPFPMIAWETERIVYFLVTDNDATQTAVLDRLGLVPRGESKSNAATTVPQ